MISLDELLRAKRNGILRLAEKYGARNVRVFGSVVRGESGPDSDVDFLVDMDPGRSFFDHVALLEDLRALLGRKVDVVTGESLYWLLRRRILREAKPL